MNDHYIEASQSYESDAREGDRERAYEKKEAQYDVHEPDTFERLTLGEKMGEILNETKKLKEMIDEPLLSFRDKLRFFKEEQYHDHYQDNLI